MTGLDLVSSGSLDGEGLQQKAASSLLCDKCYRCSIVLPFLRLVAKDMRSFLRVHGWYQKARLTRGARSGVVFLTLHLGPRDESSKQSRSIDTLTLLKPLALLEYSMVLLYCIHVLLLTIHIRALPSLLKLTPYAPSPAQCPTTGLARDAIGLSAEEEQYRQKRSTFAGEAMTTWFTSLNSGLHASPTFDLGDIEWPVMGLATSGGGIGSMIYGAGAIQALDIRDSTKNGLSSNLSGLYQACTYHTGTSTGAWTLAGLVGNEGATVSSLVSDKWTSSFADSSFVPLLGHRRPSTYSRIMMDAVAKSVAGYTPTLVDTWGRLIALHVLSGGGGEAADTLSGLVNRSDFKSFGLPYPIMTALNVDPRQNLTGCNYGTLTSPQYEFHPYEFGSWDAGIRSFSKTQFMGSQSVAGFARSPYTCITGFDNMGFLLGASTNLFNYYFAVVPSSNRFEGQLGNVYNDLIDMTGMVHGLSLFDEYAAVPGPFAPTTHLDNLFLVDGSQGGEVIPVWPLLVAGRNVSVVIVPDFSTNSDEALPDGSSLFNTYTRAQRMVFSRMPAIPTPSEFSKKGLNDEPTFFGCGDAGEILIIYIPNRTYVLGTNVPWWQLQINSALVQSMIKNGNLVATMNGLDDWPVCVGCAIYSKSNKAASMPAACKACFERFCWRG